jgi:hypothetical protein
MPLYGPVSRPIAFRRHDSDLLRALTGPVPYRGHRLVLGESGPGGERVTEPLVSERLANLSCQLRLPSAERGPRAESRPVTQTLGRPGQSCRPFGVAFGDG